MPSSRRKRLFLDRLWQRLLLFLSVIGLLMLAFVLFFLLREAWPLFAKVPLRDFLFGQRWMPLAFSGEPSFGIFPFILATLAVSALAVAMALFWSVGVSLFLALLVGPRLRALIYACIDLLAAIPSVVYGFLGLLLLVPCLRSWHLGQGHSVLAASLLLTVMLLPFLIAAVTESLLKEKERYLAAAEALGLERWYVARSLLLPAAGKSILLALILAIGRAMGETMAVMMVIGNAKLLPHLLGKAETIAALIALEMGTAEVGSLHYHALYAAGVVLLLCLLAINALVMALRRRLFRGAHA